MRLRTLIQFPLGGEGVPRHPQPPTQLRQSILFLPRVFQVGLSNCGAHILKKVEVHLSLVPPSHHVNSFECYRLDASYCRFCAVGVVRVSELDHDANQDAQKDKTT